MRLGPDAVEVLRRERENIEDQHHELHENEILNFRPDAVEHVRRGPGDADNVFHVPLTS